MEQTPGPNPSPSIYRAIFLFVHALRRERERELGRRDETIIITLNLLIQIHFSLSIILMVSLRAAGSFRVYFTKLYPFFFHNMREEGE